MIQNKFQTVFDQLAIHFTATGRSVPENLKEYALALSNDIPDGITEKELLQAFKDHRFRVKAPPAVSDIIKLVQEQSKPKVEIHRIEADLRGEWEKSLVYKRSKGLIKGEVSPDERKEALKAMQELTREHTGVLKEKYNEYLNYMMTHGEYHPEIQFRGVKCLKV